MTDLESTTDILFHVFQQMKEAKRDVPTNMLTNHELIYIGPKYTYGSQPAEIYDGHNVTVITQISEEQPSKHYQTHKILNVYKR